MDSYEQMRRKNQMLKDLKKFHFAATTDEAVKQAEAMLQETRGSGDIFVKQDEINKVEQVQKTHVAMDQSLDAVKRELMGQMSKEMDVIKEKMNEMIQVINTLEEKMKVLEKRPVQQGQQQLTQPAQQAPPPQAASPQAHQSETKASPRSGGYSPQDVSIEKMFYYGK